MDETLLPSQTDIEEMEENTDSILQLISHSEADRADVLRIIKSWPLLSVQLRKALLAIVGTQ